MFGYYEELDFKIPLQAKDESHVWNQYYEKLDFKIPLQAADESHVWNQYLYLYY